jgi:hypothetical protein
MRFDWGALVDRLRKYPRGHHQFLAPCPHDGIAAVEKTFGAMPAIIRGMLEHFNGAELIIGGLGAGPMLTLFRISTTPSLPSLKWGDDWYIDNLTPKWRERGPNRNNDWAIGMTNYGGLILFSESRGIKEWDTGETRWLLEDIPFGDWIEKVISEGEVMMVELKLDDSHGQGPDRIT